eukprot:scaffold163058_cov17-Prasinocladus_malaysianus.AAC.1
MSIQLVLGALGFKAAPGARGLWHEFVSAVVSLPLIYHRCCPGVIRRCPRGMSAGGPGRPR